MALEVLQVALDEQNRLYRPSHPAMEILHPCSIMKQGKESWLILISTM